MNKRRRPHEEKINESWLIPYADILTLLLALFIVLFAAGQLDQQKMQQIGQSFNEAFSGSVSFFEYTTPVPDEVVTGKLEHEDIVSIGDLEQRGFQHDSSSESSFVKQIQLETEDLQQLKKQIDAYIVDNGLEAELHTELNFQQLKITVQDKALFDSGSAVVRAEARDIGLAISDLLENYPDYQVQVSGHTDNVPINTARFRSNWDLSAYRSLNFMNVLLQNKELHAERFSTVAYGEHRPIADNETAEGRAQNRRVEISILRNYVDPAREQTIPADASE